MDNHGCLFAFVEFLYHIVDGYLEVSKPSPSAAPEEQGEKAIESPRAESSNGEAMD